MTDPRELREQLAAEELRAGRAEAHLRDALALLSEIRTIAADGRLIDKIDRMLTSRQPAACEVYMSCYQTCPLGTRGCPERHEDQCSSSMAMGRLTVPLGSAGGARG